MRAFVKQHYEKPAQTGCTIIMELDEMRHYLEKNTETLDLEGDG